MARFSFEFELPEKATGTAQQKGVSSKGGKVHFYTKGKVKKTRGMYIVGIRSAFARAGVPIPYLEGAVLAHVEFHVAVKNKRLWGQFKPTLPDCDNLVKELLDALTDLHFWRDDGQIAALEVQKYYAEKDIIKIVLEDKL